MFQLRDYQEECNTAIRYGHQEHDSVCVEKATGLGKTVAFTRYAADFNAATGRRAMVIAPQITLIGQAAKKIRKETGVMPAIEQADQRSNETAHGKVDFVVASKQTLTSNDRYKRFLDIGLVVVDECHYAATESYKKLLDHFIGCGAKILGVSATLKRHDNRAIGQLFETCCYQYGISEAIADGWLVPIKVTCKQLEKLDLSRVTTTNGFFGKDFNQKQLNETLENPEVIYEIAAAINEETRGQKTAVFCSSVNEAQAVAEYLVDEYGIKADWVCADTSRCSESKRAEVMRSIVDPDGISHICNVGVLTTGWDFPGLANIVMARPTKSKPLYTQILGRCTRPLEGTVDFEGSTPELRRAAIAASAKPFGRVIDLVDASMKHKIMTASDVLGGRWSLVSESEAVCRFCFEQFANRMELTLHLTEKHSEEMLNAQGEDEEEAKAAQLAAAEQLRRQRAAVKAQAQFRNVEVDPFGGARSNGRSLSQVEVASDKQRRYMWVLGFKDVDKYMMTKAQARRVISQLKGGMTRAEIGMHNRLVRRS